MILAVSGAAQAVEFNAPGFTYTKVVDGGAFIISGAAFSPDGTKIAYIERDNTLGVRRLQLLDRTTSATTTLTTYGTSLGSLTQPYFSADGAKVGWTRSASAGNDLMVYTISGGTMATYTGPVGAGDVRNSTFLGASTDQWAAWAAGNGGGADLFLYSVNPEDSTKWVQGANLTNTADYKEYTPSSNKAGTKLVYWSGETTLEPLAAVHTLTNVGGVWTKDVGFSAITGSAWGYLSADDSKIGVTKDGVAPGTGMGDLYVYDTSGNFLFDLTGTAVGQGTNWQYFGHNFNVGNDYLFTSNVDFAAGRDIWIATVPEPATMALLAAGGIATLLRRRRSSKK
jgi:hypothetical protein